ncbi:hypothetical protein PFISCL1PPCAC_11151 [Pristionchus fissidentatus]|uniref:Uncharacterized protein n=1 Tax=Pristionchus fissidentatus TaxID=1538716 RepID=A0AAV5VPZ9_9BILA|nr:hypothetical protein PFISCL1PPCAC_11151 [Pristionchus fissidentatus]
MCLKTVGVLRDYNAVLLDGYCSGFNCRRPGYEVEAVRYAMAIAGYCGEIIQRDLTIDESLEMISNGSADLAHYLIRQTPARMHKVAYSVAPFSQSYGFISAHRVRVRGETVLSMIPLWMGTLVFGSIIALAVLHTAHKHRLSLRPVRNWFSLVILKCVFAHICDYLRVMAKQANLKLSGLILCLAVVPFLFSSVCLTSVLESELRDELSKMTSLSPRVENLDQLISLMSTEGFSYVRTNKIYELAEFCKKEQCKQLERINRTMTYGSFAEYVESLEDEKKTTIMSADEMYEE